MTERELQLLAEMKHNCSKQDYYIDDNAREKLRLLEKLEFVANSYMLYLNTEISITNSKLNRCEDETAKVYLYDHLETVKAIKRKLEEGDF